MRAILLTIMVLFLACAGPPAQNGQAAPVSPDPSASQAAPPPLKSKCQDDGICEYHTGLGRYLSAATLAGDDVFYAAHLNGDIVRYDLGRVSKRKVAGDLLMPQGLVIADGRLYATHLNNFCDEIKASGHLLIPEALGRCDFKARDLVPDLTLEDALDDLMARTSGEIVSWRIDPATGDLGDRRVELDQLPVIGRDHSPNGLTVADGWIYASIGHPFNDPTTPGAVTQTNDFAYQFNIESLRRPDTAGAIIRFRPGAAGEYEVFASGLRNVYGISVAADGTVYGADNDSTAPGPGKALEELNAIKQGRFYGYPEYGTNFAPPEAGVTEPVAVLDGSGATFAHAADDAVYAAYSTGEGDGFVVDRFQYDTWERDRFYRNADSYIVSIHERDGRLYLFTLSGSLTIVDKAHAGTISARGQ